MSTFIVILVISAVASKESENPKTSTSSLLENIQKLIQEKLPSARKTKELDISETNRQGKNFGYYPYFPNPVYNYPQHDLGYYYPQGKTPISQEWRTEPFKRKPSQPLLDSPIYYVRLPASPYVFVPGVGYISRPPSLAEPGVLNALAESKPEPSQNSESNFINVPIDFVSNGKPTSVYQLPNDPIPKPKPDNSYYNLNKGPYYFNGKPIEFYILRNAYDRIYADALTNFYP